MLFKTRLTKSLSPVDSNSTKSPALGVSPDEYFSVDTVILVCYLVNVNKGE